MNVSTSTVPPTAGRATPGSIVLDVYPAAPLDLRRRLQGHGTSMRLPGGLRLDETMSGAVYALEAEGNWEVVQHGGTWTFRHTNGHVVELGRHGLTVRPVH